MKRSAEIRELLGTVPVSLVIMNGRFRRLGHVESKADADWIKCCMSMRLMEQERLVIRVRLGGRHEGDKEDTKSLGTSQEDAQPGINGKVKSSDPGSPQKVAVKMNCLRST